MVEKESSPQESREVLGAAFEEDHERESRTGASLNPPPMQFNASGGVIQRDNNWVEGMRTIRERGLFGALSDAYNDLTADDLDDAQDVLDDINTGLTTADHILQSGIMTSTDPNVTRRLRQLKSGLGRIQGFTSAAQQVGEVYNNIQAFRSLLHGIENMPENITQDPEGAADAFGEITSSIGTLGGLLPEGPWSGYMTFLAGSREFFTNMYQQINVDAITANRFRRQGLDPNNPGGLSREQGLPQR